MKRALLFVILALPAWCQTAINDTIYHYPSAPWSGYIDISWPAFTTSTGVAVAKGMRTVKVTDGVLSVSLYPNEGGSPTVSYTAKYRSSVASFSETWSVPVTASILTVRQVRRTSNQVVYPSQLDGTGAVLGAALCWDGSKYAPGSCAGGGGGGGGTWGTIIGSIADQADLKSALDAKAALVHSHVIADTAALQAALDGKAATTHNQAMSTVTGLQTALDAKQGLSQRGAADGYAPLGSDGLVPTAFLPAASGLTAISQDLTPMLGGNMSMNGFSLQTVTPTEMAWIHGLTGHLQTQLDGKSATGHNHLGTYEPVDATLLRQANLAGTGVATTPARSDHNHTATYVALGGSYANPSWLVSIPWSKITSAPGTYVPSTHATSHQNGGSDEVGTVTPGAGAIPKADGTGKIPPGWIPTLNQNTSGTAAGLSAQFIDWSASSGGASIANKPAIVPVVASVSYSATPTFTVTGNGLQGFLLTLTGNVTSSTLSGPATGQEVWFKICQDGTGSRTFAWPSNVVGGAVIDYTASSCTKQSFRYDGTNAQAVGAAAYETTATPAIIDKNGNVYTLPTSSTTKALMATDTAVQTSQLPSIAESKLSLTDNTTGNVSASAHGFVPKLPNDSSQCFRGDGTYGACGSGGTGVGRASLAVTYTAIVDGACQDKTATWTGSTTSDTIILGPPSGLTAGLFASAWISASDTATIRVCNMSGASVTPGAQTFKGTLAIYNLSGTSTINFSSIPDGTCASSTFALTGVAAGDPVTPKWPAALETGLVGAMVASATDTVQVRLCNWSGAAVDPASATFGAAIAK